MKRLIGCSMLFFLSISYALSTQRTGGGTGHTTRLQTRREARRNRRRQWVREQMIRQDFRYARSIMATGFVFIGFVFILGHNIINIAENPIPRIIAILSLLIVGVPLSYVRYRVDEVIRDAHRGEAELLTEAALMYSSPDEEE